MYASDYFETGVLNTLKGRQLNAPAKLYIALYISDPTETGTGGTEITYEGYQRQEIKFTPPAVDAGTQNAITIKNESDIRFPTPNTDAGTVQYVALFDSQTKGAGNMWAYGRAREDLVIRAGQIPVIVAGEIRYYLTGNFSETYQRKVLDVMRGTNLPGVTPHYALYSGSPENGGKELTGGGYIRQPIEFKDVSPEPSGQSVTSNTAKISFPRPTQNLGAWTHSAIYTLQTQGEPIVITALPNSEDVKQGYLVFADPETVRVYFN